MRMRNSTTFAMSLLAAGLMILSGYIASSAGSWWADARRPVSATPLLLGAHEEPRSSHWPTVRKHHLEIEPACIICGSMDDLNVHHVESFRTNPERELDQANLVTLCRHDHWTWGHLLDWKSENASIRKDAAWFRAKVRAAKESQ